MTIATVTATSPFNLDQPEAYAAWRKVKLSNAQTQQNKPFLPIQLAPPHLFGIFSGDNSCLIDIANTIKQHCHVHNYCVYRLHTEQALSENESKQIVHALARACGLSQLDNNLCADADKLSTICQHSTNNKGDNGEREYIPYTNKALSWHTDGYYNPPNKTIRAMLLHCYQAAADGGESAFLDHEIAYILLRDENPEWIHALSQPQAMTIPANEQHGKIIRPRQSGAVFSLSPSGQLQMRYSARKRHIRWQADPHTQAAREFLSTLLQSDSPYILRHTLAAGEGIISKNILHCRSAFTNATDAAQQRVLFRGRFYDEIISRDAHTTQAT